MSNSIVEFCSISKTFTTGFLRRRSLLAVNNISLTIEQGETLCLIGPNGAGKTTLIRMLLDFIKPTSGYARLFGQPNTIPSLRDSIGYFPERSKYPPRLTVNQFLIYWGRFSGLDGKVLTSRVNELLKFVRLEEKRDTLIKDLSKGMTVRLGLAQALLNDPKLLILDEPTDGLDPLGRIEFRDMLIDLKAREKTILMNSHLLSEVERLSSRVGIMDKGQILAVDEVEKLISSTNKITIQFRGTSTESLSMLGENLELKTNGELHTLVLADPQLLDSTIKQLIALGATIQSVEQNKDALESKFLTLIKPQP